MTRPPAAGSAAEAVVDREHELTRMDAALEQASSGRSALVVIEADAGMGKSTLIDVFLAGCGDGVTTRRFAGAEPEQDVPFGLAGLVLGEEVPPTYSGVEVGRRLMAWVSAAQEAAGQDVVVLVVDDAQWMDPESAQSLQFVLRRLRADRVLVVIAQRPTPRATGSAFGVLPMGTVLATVVRPGPLDVAAVRDFADQTRQWSVSPRLPPRSPGRPAVSRCWSRRPSAEHPIRSSSGPRPMPRRWRR